MRARTALLSFALLAAVAPPSDASYSARPHAALQRLFDTYGNGGKGDRWTGGALDQAVTLPDGRTVWVFGRTYLGTVAANRSRAADTPFVWNSYVVQERNGRLSKTLLGAGKTALFTPSEPGHYYEPASAVVANGKLYQLLWLTADQSFPGRLDVATISLPSLKVESITPMKHLGYVPTAQAGVQVFPPVWGSAIASDAKYHYVFGYENTHAGFEGFAHVSRVPLGQLTTASPEFWDGSAWSPVPVTSARIFGGSQLGTRSFSVTKTPKGFRAIGQGHTQTGIYEFTATSVGGPWKLAFLYKFVEEPTNKAAGFGPQNSAPTHLPRYETKKSQLAFAYLNDGGPDRTTHVKKYRPVFLVATDG